MPKSALYSRSGAMIRVISCSSFVFSQVGNTPSVTPLSGSTAINGTGITGQVETSSQPPLGAGGAGAGTGGLGASPMATANAISAAASPAAAAVTGAGSAA